MSREQVSREKGHKPRVLHVVLHVLVVKRPSRICLKERSKRARRKRSQGSHCKRSQGVSSPLAIQITHLVLSLGAFFSSCLVLSPLPRVLAAAAPVNRARAGQRQQVRRESRTQETSRARRSAGRRSTRKRTKSLHDGRSPLPMCHRFPRLSEQIDEESGGFLLPSTAHRYRIHACN